MPTSADAVDACLALVRPAAEDKRIKLELMLVAALPATVSGHTTRLQQILLNLLWNALKFTPPDGSVTLRVGAGADWLHCEVIDTGPGIPAEQQAMLFQDFGRPDPNAADGTGRGLAISARLAERMGGRLVYHPGPGGVGSRFRLELPWPATDTTREDAQERLVRGSIEPPPGQAHEESGVATADTPARPVRPRSARLHLLVVDDLPANRAMLRALLTSDGHCVTAAQNGAEAVELTSRDRFDAVLMDVRMPVMDGIEATRRIRKLPGEVGSTPIIAISADLTVETMPICLAAGMNAMLAKPIDREALVATLRRLERHRCRPPAGEMAPSGAGATRGG
jgi:CheY-like chemotaxis protein